MDLTEFSSWIPSLGTATAISILAFIFRNWFMARITNSVKHEYDTKLEGIKSELKMTEQELLFKLKLRDRELQTLKSGALSNLSQRQVVLYEKQIEAVERIWSVVSLTSTLKMIPAMMSSFKMDEVSKAISTTPNLQKTFKMIGGNVDDEKIKKMNASAARPFVSVLVWAYFSAYQTIVFHYIAQLKLLEMGMELKFVKTENMVKLVKKLLPHQAAYIDEFGPDAAFHLLDEVEAKLLSEIEKMLKGKGLSEESIKEAAQISDIARGIQARDSFGEVEG
jgi:hypothetical protein